MKKRFICLALSAATVFAVGGVGKKASADAIAPDYSDATGHVVLDSWIGPSMTDEAYAEYAECGYNRVHYNNTSVHVEGGKTEADFKNLNQQLDTHFTLAEKYGIDVILAMNARNTNQTNATSFEWVDEKFHETLQKWKTSDTFYGYMPYDEPSFSVSLTAENPSMYQRDYDDVADYILDEYIYFKHNYPGKKFEVAMLRDANTGETMGYQRAGSKVGEGATYEQYLDYYYDNVMKYMPYEDRVCSMDAYAFGSRSESKETVYYIRDCWVSSLEKNGYQAEKTNAEKWTYTMNHANITNPESIVYQYYTAMAYGYTNFITYCYRDNWSLGASSISSQTGEKTNNWYYYKAAHEEIKTFESVYLQFVDDWRGALVYSGSQSTTAKDGKAWNRATHLLSSYDRIKSCTATQDTLIGVMADQNGYEGFMLTNQSTPQYPTQDSVSVTFKNATKALIYTDGNEGKIVDLSNGKLDITLKAGGGAFVIPY